MANIPTNGEIAFYLMLILILALGLLFINYYADSEHSVDDLDAWTRNYDKIQRRQK